MMPGALCTCNELSLMWQWNKWVLSLYLRKKSIFAFVFVGYCCCQRLPREKSIIPEQDWKKLGQLHLASSKDKLPWLNFYLPQDNGRHTNSCHASSESPCHLLTCFRLIILLCPRCFLCMSTNLVYSEQQVSSTRQCDIIKLHGTMGPLVPSMTHRK